MTPNTGINNMNGEPSATPASPNDNGTAKSLPFNQWLQAVAFERDKQAFARLFEYFAPRVYAIARGKLGSDALAKEA